MRKILAREKITAFTTEGKQYIGTPVLESEWPSCPNGMRTILVDKIDENTGIIGKLIETFTVIKEHGKNPRKGGSLQVCMDPPPPLMKPRPVRSIGYITLKRKGETCQVQIFESTDDVREARKAGLNGGTRVAVPTANGTYEVFAVHSETLKKLGRNFRPLKGI
ncbi:MAG: hypothetical protein WA014_03870 [Minisyncoccia bacterium]